MVETVNSKFGAFCLFLTGFPNFWMIGYVFSQLSPVLPVLNHMYNTTYTERHGMPISEETWTLLLTLTSSFVIVGGFIGSTTTKYWLTFLSKKRLLQVCHVLIIISILLLALVGCLTWSYEVMIIGRLVFGISLGIFFGLVPAVIAELSARSSQAFWQSICGIGIMFGALCAGVFAHPKVLGTIYGLPVVFALPAVPSIIYLLASFRIPETPYHLLRTGTEKDALEVVQILRKSNEAGCSDELERMKMEMESKDFVGIKEMLTVRQYRNQLFAVVALYANLMLTGINNVIIYTDVIVQQAGVSAEVSPSVTVGLFGLLLVSAIFGSKFIDRFGALKMNIACGIGIVIAYTVLTISRATTHLAPSVMPFVSVASIGCFMICWAAGPNLATLVLLGELTIEPVRPTAFAFGGFVLWILSWLVGFLPPYLEVCDCFFVIGGISLFTVVGWACLVSSVLLHFLSQGHRKRGEL